MLLRTRLAVLTGAAFLATSGFAAIGVATASAVPPPVEYCNGQQATIVITTPGVVTQGNNDPAYPDVIVGTNGPDTINAWDGNDTICGRGGDDLIYAGDGADYVFGEGDNDTMWGDVGNDFLAGGAGLNDQGHGQDGGDTCPASTEIRVSCELP